MLCGTVALGQGAGTGCSSGKRVDNFFYTDCWTDTGDDTTRLQSAMSAAAGSTLIFNEANYQISGALPVYSNSILEGTAPAEGSSNSKITLTVTGGGTQSVFSIGTGIRAVTIKNLGLYATQANTYGIEALGTTGSASSQLFHFSNMWIKGFTKGIYVHTTDGTKGWQFDDVHVEDVAFDACDDGIYLDTQNTGWQMNNLMFGSAANKNAIHIEYGGYINMNLIVGNGTFVSGVQAAGEFIRIEGHHGPINMQNVNGEGYKKTLIINGIDSFKTFPIMISNSDLQECHWVDGGVTKPSVVFKNTTVVSQANSYACYGKVARPSIEGWAEVYSTGDKFCYDTTADCFDTSDPYDDSTRSGWAINSAIALVRTDSIGDYDDWTKAFMDLTSTYGPGEAPYKPLLSLTHSLYSSGTWYKYRYTFTRNVSTGRLEMNGDLNGTYPHSSSSPSIGYYFKNGPVQLHGVTAATLSGGTYNWPSGDKGSMLYCSDCTAGTNPCSTSGGGGGALAIRIESGNWACK
jgi:hypothetical protein